MWRHDPLGDGYLCEDIALGEDEEGALLATLVHRRAPVFTRRAVLYVHGYNDYFFQSELGIRWNEAGVDFYAIDLHKHGRSLRPGQTPCFVHELRDYYAELDEAVRRIRYRDGHNDVVLLAHSTGGLTGVLYAHDRRRRRPFSKVVLNSPFFDFAESDARNRVLQRLAALAGWWEPRRRVSHERQPYYAWSLAASYDRGGQWSYDEAWKQPGTLPVRAGWVRAVRRGHQRVACGLKVGVPVLVLHSSQSGGGTTWNDSYFHTDAVLDVRSMARLSPRLGSSVGRVGIRGAVHDVILSKEPAREQAYQEMLRFVLD